MSKHVLFPTGAPQVGRLYLAIQLEHQLMHMGADILYSSTYGVEVKNVTSGKTGSPVTPSPFFDVIVENGHVVLELHNDDVEHVYIAFNTLKMMMSPPAP